MTQLLVVIVVALVTIAASAIVGPRLGIASPLVLVAIGVGASFVPMIGTVEIEPEWILEGILPPLLYSSAVSMPSMNFRREFSAISGLSVVLVVGTSLVLGVFFMLVIPGLGFAWCVALGAIISPTDAVATSIVKGTSVSKRVIAMLDGESLLNDATALVLLRTALAAIAGSFSFGSAVGSFVLSVVVAVAVGLAVGWLNLLVRQRITDPTVNTVISFTVPFLASVPATLLHGSGLVAAVVAGLVTGIRAPRLLSPENRLSDSQNWRTVELVLEGAVFLTMGLQMREVVMNVAAQHAGVGLAVLIAAGALVLTLVVRAAYVAPLLGYLQLQRRGNERLGGRMRDFQDRMSTPEGKQEALDRWQDGPRAGHSPSESQLQRFTTRVTRTLATIEYFRREPLGWRDGAAVVWAGMRGAVTVAAAQTLPDGPHRSALVLIAFTVAVISLLVQGGTIGPLTRLLAPPPDPEAAAERTRAERDRIFELLKASAEGVEKPDGVDDPQNPEAFELSRTYRLAVIAAQRAALLDARDNGTFDADVLETALQNMDAAQITITMRGKFAT